MKLLKMPAPELIEFPGVSSNDGDLWFAEVDNQLPFAIKRIYYIVDMPANAKRGAHAHKRLDQLIIAMQGSFIVDITDGENDYSFKMSAANQALYLPGGYWRSLKEFSPGSICLVLASERYESDDYIRDYDQFLSWKAEQVSL